MRVMTDNASSAMRVLLSASTDTKCGAMAIAYCMHQQHRVQGAYMIATDCRRGPDSTHHTPPTVEQRPKRTSSRLAVADRADSRAAMPCSRRLGSVYPHNQKHAIKKQYQHQVKTTVHTRMQHTIHISYKYTHKTTDATYPGPSTRR
jgi:hypothetical protein